MGCGCGKVNKATDLENFAFLTPRQLKIREAQRLAKLQQEKKQAE